MPLATKNGSLIVKDGKLAESCGCCDEWVCAGSDFGACCGPSGCRVVRQCDCDTAHGERFLGIGTNCSSILSCPGVPVCDVYTNADAATLRVTVNITSFTLRDAGEGVYCGSIFQQAATTGRWPSRDAATLEAAYPGAIAALGSIGGSYDLVFGQTGGIVNFDPDAGFGVVVGRYGYTRPDGKLRLQYILNCKGWGELRVGFGSEGFWNQNLFYPMWDDGWVSPNLGAQRTSSIPTLGVSGDCASNTGSLHDLLSDYVTGGDYMVRVGGNTIFSPVGYFFGSATVTKTRQ
jgi:hypothetical protein